MCLESIVFPLPGMTDPMGCAMFLMTTGYAASRAALGLLSVQETISTPRKVLPRTGSQCGVGEASLKNVAQLPESALA